MNFLIVSKSWSFMIEHSGQLSDLLSYAGDTFRDLFYRAAGCFGYAFDCFQPQSTTIKQHW